MLSSQVCCPRKKRRDRLIRLACNHPTWALGKASEVWWSRLAQPEMHTWRHADQITRLYELARAKDDPDPKALAHATGCCFAAARCRPTKCCCVSWTAAR